MARRQSRLSVRDKFLIGSVGGLTLLFVNVVVVDRELMATESQMSETQKDAVDSSSQQRQISTKTPALAEVVPAERFQKWVALEVAEEVKQRVSTWAAWIGGPILALVTFLGLTTYRDVQRKISAAITPTTSL